MEAPKLSGGTNDRRVACVMEFIPCLERELHTMAVLMICGGMSMFCFTCRVSRQVQMKGLISWKKRYGSFVFALLFSDYIA